MNLNKLQDKLNKRLQNRRRSNKVHIKITPGEYIGRTVTESNNHLFGSPRKRMSI